MGSSPLQNSKITAAFFNVNVGEEIPKLIILENGEITNRNGVACIQQHGAGAYPFSQERMDEIVNGQPSQQYSADSLQSLLVDGNKDYLIRSSGEKVSMFFMFICWCMQDILVVA